MNGRDLLIGLGNIPAKYYDEAENDSISAPSAHKSFRKIFLVAAVIALTSLLAMSAAAYAFGWLTDFFSTQSNSPLSSEQIKYIEDNEKSLGKAQTHDGWTIQLKSAMNDGRTAYIILGVTAPKKIDLESSGMVNYYLGGEFADLIGNNRDIAIYSESSGWELDHDGLPNTLDYTIRFEPEEDKNAPAPFGDDVEWNIQIENIICQRENTAYYKELLRGKYKDQADFMLTEEEINKLYQQETIAKGVWDFRFTFDKTSTGAELVSSPVTVKAYATRNSESSYQEITITSFTLNSFSAQIDHTADALVNFTNPAEEKVVAMMRDGSEIKFHHFSSSRTTTTLNSYVPIVLSEVDHIRMPDGTILPMPD